MSWWLAVRAAFVGLVILAFLVLFVLILLVFASSSRP